MNFDQLVRNPVISHDPERSLMSFIAILFDRRDINRIGYKLDLFAAKLLMAASNDTFWETSLLMLMTASPLRRSRAMVDLK